MKIVSRTRAHRGTLAVLLGTSSLLTLVSVVPAIAQQVAAAPAEAPAEDVLITGSLIHGAEVVGAPVTSLGLEDFKVTGAVTLGDLLRTQPAVFVSPSTSSTGTAGNSERQARVDIHNFGSGHTLGLFNGMRFPAQSHTGTIFDPSFIPQLAIDRVDVLAGGASATYGSDAEAGVVNIILKRGFEGAITQGRVGIADGGGFNWQATQLYGRTWDSGDITVTFEHYDIKEIAGSKRDYLTVDFTPWGLSNQTPVRSSLPGTVSTGAPSPTTGTDCTNCYSVPRGQNGVGLTWATLLANKGVTNEVNPYTLAQLTPPQQNNSATLTFDQRIADGVELFIDAFYANRRGQQIVPATVNPASSGTIFTLAVPTTNPYYPVGAPAGLRVSYSFGKELPPRSSYYEISGRYAGGFNLDLPFDWHGKIYGSVNDEKNVTVVSNLVNANNALAALGATVASIPASGSTPGIAAFTKPATVPFLNLFCDPTAFTCNDQRTLDYITSDEARNQGSRYMLHEYGANFDGALFDLPGGPVRAAVGGNYVDYNYYVYDREAFSAPVLAFPTMISEANHRTTYAFFGQLNIPLVGEMNKMPFIEEVNVEASVRYDHYSDFGGATNPKVAVNWTIADGFTLHGSWGTSFVAPSFAQLSAVTSRTVQPINTVAGSTANSLPTCPAIGSAPVAGSAGADVNPTCNSALQFAGGILVKGGVGGLSGLLRPDGYALGPETSDDIALGFQFVPTDNILSGLNINVNYWRSKITNLNVQIDDTSARLTDPNTAFVFLTPANTPNFAAVVSGLLAFPDATGFSSGAAANISFILDGAARNAGSITHDGIDFSASYDWDMGDYGAWNVGAVGTYYLHYKTAVTPGSTAIDLEDAPGLAYRNGAVVSEQGQTQDVRMRYRGRLGVAFDDWTLTGFVNYRSHFFTKEALPASSVLAAAGITNYANFVPSYYTFDVSASYDLGEKPANDYLKNLSFQFVVNNITNKEPPFAYKSSTSGNGAAAFWGLIDNPVQRQFSLTVTKTW